MRAPGADDLPPHLKECLDRTAEALAGHQLRAQVRSLSQLTAQLKDLSEVPNRLEVAKAVSVVALYSHPERVFPSPVRKLLDDVTHTLGVLGSQSPEILQLFCKAHQKVVKRLSKSDRLAAFHLCKAFFIFLHAGASDNAELLGDSEVKSTASSVFAALETACLTPRLRAPLLRSLDRLVSGVPSVLSLLKEFVLAPDTPPSGATMMACGLLEWHSGEQRRGRRKGSIGVKGDGKLAQALESLYSDLTAKFVQSVFESRHFNVCGAFRGLLRVLKAEDMQSRVVPGVVRVVKRSSEAGLPVLFEILEDTKCDLSGCWEDLMSGCVSELLKSPNAKLRAGAARVCEMLGPRLAGDGALSGCTASVVGSLQGGNAQTRQAAFDVLRVLLSNPKSASTEERRKAGAALMAASEALSKTGTSELNEEVRSACLAVIGLAIRLSGFAPSSHGLVEVLLSAATTDKKAKEGVKLAALQALVSAVEGAEKDALSEDQVKKLVGPVIKEIIPAAQTKPGMRGPSLEGWRLVSVLHWRDACAGKSTVGDLLTSGGLIDQLKSPLCYLNSQGPVFKASLQDVQREVELLGRLLCLNPPLIGDLDLAPQPPSLDMNSAESVPLPPHFDEAAPTSVMLPGVMAVHAGLVHSLIAYEERRMFRLKEKGEETAALSAHSSGDSALSRILAVGNLPALAASLVRYLYCFVSDASSRSFYHPNRVTDSRAKNPDAQVIPCPAATRSALTLAVRMAGSPGGSVAEVEPVLLGHAESALVALLCCHPFLETEGRGRISLRHQWNEMTGGRWDACMDWGSVRSMIERAATLPSPDPSGMRTACIRLCRLFGETKKRKETETEEKDFGGDSPTANGTHHTEDKHSALSHLVSSLRDLLNAKDLSSTSDRHIKIFFHPEGSLYRDEGIYVASTVADKNVKIDKNLRELYGDEVAAQIASGGSAPSPAAASAPKPAQEPPKPAAAPKPKAAKAKGKAKMSMDQLLSLTKKGKDSSAASAVSTTAPASTHPTPTPGRQGSLNESGGGSASASPMPAAPSGNLTKAELEQVKIREQSELRRKVKVKLDKTTYALECLANLSDAAPVAFAHHAKSLVPEVQMLLGCPLSSCAALRTLRSFARALVPCDLVPQRAYLPDSLFRFALKETPDDQTVGLLASVSSESALPQCAFSLLLPVVAAILGEADRAGTKACNQAAQFLAQQLRLKAKVDCALVLKCLGEGIRKFPAVVPSAAPALLVLCRDYISTSEDLLSLADILIADDGDVRSSVLLAISQIPETTQLEPVAAYLAAMQEDPDSERNSLAKELVEERGVLPDSEHLSQMIELLHCRSDVFRSMTAHALAKLLADLSAGEDEDEPADEETIAECIQDLTKTYQDPKTELKGKMGVALTLVAIPTKVPLSVEAHVRPLFDFLLRTALDDPEVNDQPELRETLINAGSSIVDSIAKSDEDAAQDLHGLLVEATAAVHHSTRNKEATGAASAVFLGALAKHLPPESPDVADVLQRLLGRLLDPRAPSASVQRVIAKSIPPLVKQCSAAGTFDPQEGFRRGLNAALTEAGDVGRTGGALCLTAVVKGMGITAIKQLEVIKTLQEAAEHKTDAVRRQGALQCFECLSDHMGRLFEPYVIQTLPILLNAFSDAAAPVRQAAQQAARAIMSALSAHGVRMVLPVLLQKVADRQWRTKLGSIELLGAMANCSPKQLAGCLPQVVPALCDVVSDTHMKVKEAAHEALKAIGSVITNPEIQALVPKLIVSLTDPSDATASKQALDALLTTEFVHSVDAPSLALVCPIVTRALRERGSEVKKKAAQIVASMTILIKDRRDFLPYYPAILPHLKQTLVDPIPDVRATAASACGTIARGLGEDHLDDLLPFLFTTLKSSESAVERSGAANGLSEVLVALGPSKLQQFLPDILNNASDVNSPAEVREGYLGLFIFLPAAFKQDFQDYVPAVLPTLLRGLADTQEPVRNVSFRAALAMVDQYGSTHTALLLPPLEDGMFSVDWRIRRSSVELLGALIDRILKGVGAGSQAELMSSEVLSRERRAFILSSLHIVKSDESPVVRQVANSVWKSVVNNTPRTLREILPILMERLIRNLGSDNLEKQRGAGRCLGDLVQKLGERVLPELMPIFMLTLKSPESHTRQGVCIGIAEVIASAPKSLLTDHIPELLPALKSSLKDPSRNVRRAATRCISMMLEQLGPACLDDAVKWILESLTSPPVTDPRDAPPGSGERSHLLDSLEQLLLLQPGPVFRETMKVCCAPPVDVIKVRAVAAVAVCPPAAFQHSSDKIVTTLVASLTDPLPTEEDGSTDPEVLKLLRQEVSAAARRLFGRIEKEGASFFLYSLIRALQSAAPLHDASAGGRLARKQLEEKGLEMESDPQNPSRRAALSSLLEDLFEASRTEVELLSFVKSILRPLFSVALVDPDSVVLERGMAALQTFARVATKEELSTYAGDMKEELKRLVEDPVTLKEADFTLPGLSLKNGLEPFLTAYQHALMQGSNELRERAAQALGQLVSHTEEAALKPYVVKTTGPLIRIAGDRFPPVVKAAILDTLLVLLQRGGANMKPFLPQLQTTFVKSLGDTAEAVREKGASALASLCPLAGTRSEPLVNDVCAQVASQTVPEIRAATLVALADVLKGLGESVKLSKTAQEKVRGSLLPVVTAKEEDVNARAAAARALGVFLARHADASEVSSLLSNTLLQPLQSGSVEKDSKLGLALTLSWLVDSSKGGGLEGWQRLKSALRDDSTDISAVVDPVLSDALPKVRKEGTQALRNIAKLGKKKDEDTTGLFETLLPSVRKALSVQCSAANVEQVVLGLRALKMLLKYSGDALPAAQLAEIAALGTPFLQADALAMKAKLQAERLVCYVIRRTGDSGDNVDKALEVLEGAGVLEKDQLEKLKEFGRRVAKRLLQNFEESDSEAE
uniref:TOG domain-containing protein n=1 Tax=Chromera velia CCMP2878 TaxID=1169474 RepID=A0A0G4FAB6_9ALVE|eukprot:Cvel_16039.t1-p1 / transcript=Cvel_16039.t1 / gene=Cvel_16039 / organism=Chromera_velia_CCMP2878 / gene_product=Translational activator GCN1, putative / transcript_product=Translational activator GCN1, putative / location=Cvel_scaffold1218:12627-29131(-) / protein_length=2914 / sequence_SO=supercontig / SO=protein_coding / is_pseudo=false